MKGVFKKLLIITFAIVYVQCARTGRPEGGPKDETAPVFVVANPAYETTNFQSDRIRLEFNEFVVMKDLANQLIVSPPLKNPLNVFPQGSASKKFKIDILDTLQANTTYIFNFGSAVQDNNEGNALENFKYVFSTGDYIDSLTIDGKVRDVKKLDEIKKVNLLLYRLDTSYNDSAVFLRKPNYVTNTLDTTLFSFTNLKKGKYRLFALKEAINDYIYNPKIEEIGFYPDTLELPKDSILENPVLVFRETQDFAFRRAQEVTRGKIQFGFEGKRDSLQIQLLSQVSDSFASIERYETDKDTLNYWFTPLKSIDSLNFLISYNKPVDTVTVRLRKKQIDSLKIESTVGKTLDLRDTFFLKTNNPITKIDTSRIALFEADTIPLSYNILESKTENKIGILFKKNPKSSFKIMLLPNALEDIYKIKNDSLNYTMQTKEVEDYGNISIAINNPNNKNLIIELLAGKNNDFVTRQIVANSEKITFDLLPPGNYTIRAIIDENRNNLWDTGNILKWQLPEPIIYHPQINKAELRANYFLEETFTIE